MFVSPADFREHLRLLSSRYRPLAMSRFVKAWRAGTLPRNAVVVTFDDGYADNVDMALPILERFEVPATFFLTAAHIGGQREFWWDVLDRILDAEVNVTELIRATLKLDARHVTPAALHTACRSRLLAMTTAERDELVGYWGASAGLVNSRQRTDRVLDENQLAELVKHPLAEIGAHGVNHEYLPYLSPTAQFSEISQSRQLIEGRIGRRVRFFAYPFGAYDASSESAVKRAGYENAFTTEWAPVTRNCSRWRMPRLTVSGPVSRLARSLTRTA